MTPEEVSELSDDERIYFAYLEQHLVYEVPTLDEEEFRPGRWLTLGVWLGLGLLGWLFVAGVIGGIVFLKGLL